ncbi:S1 family peptidase [Actinomycetes bacterium KLBMP 9797]
MRRITPRHVVTAAAVLATVAAGTALTISANAGTGGSDAGQAAADDTPRISAAMRAALKRDLGLTDAQLDARLAREAWAATTARALRQTLGTGYAGAWLTGGQQLNVAVSERSLADKVRAAGAEPKVVARSAGQLSRVMQALDQRAANAPSAVTGWYVDPATNTVVVEATRASAARSFVRNARLNAGAVRVETVRAAPALLAGPHKPAPTPPEDTEAPPPGEEETPPPAEEETPPPAEESEAPEQTEPPATEEPADPNAQQIRGGAPYIIEEQARCSVGFAVEGGFVSAGHCGNAGDAVAVQDGQELIPLGNFQESSFPENDFSFVATNADFTPVGEVNDFGGEGAGADDLGAALPVAGAEEAVVGTAVCKFGSTTGASCGEVQALDVTVNFQDPADGQGTVEVNGLIGTNVCAEPGDSGGSLLAGDQAQGVVSGGSGDCTVGGETFFQPVNEILETLNLTLLTA